VKSDEVTPGSAWFDTKTLLRRMGHRSEGKHSVSAAISAARKYTMANCHKDRGSGLRKGSCKLESSETRARPCPRIRQSTRTPGRAATRGRQSSMHHVGTPGRRRRSKRMERVKSRIEVVRRGMMFQVPLAVVSRLVLSALGYHSFDGSNGRAVSTSAAGLGRDGREAKAWCCVGWDPYAAQEWVEEQSRRLAQSAENGQ